MSRLLVKRCVCHDTTFVDIKEYASSEGFTTVDELRAVDYCSTKCRMCEPYIEMMFETGETAFEPGAYLKQRVE